MQNQEFALPTQLTAEEFAKFKREAVVHDYEDTLATMDKGIIEAKASYYRLLSVNAERVHLEKMASGPLAWSRVTIVATTFLWILTVLK